NLAWSPDRASAVIAANAGDIDRRHLWRVAAAGGGAPQQLTHGNSVENAPVVLSGGKQIAFFRATAREPFLPYIAAADGSGARPLVAQALDASFPGAQFVEPEPVTFRAADGLEIHGQLFKPQGISGRTPAVIFMHGGPPRQMFPAWHYMYYYFN